MSCGFREGVDENLAGGLDVVSKGCEVVALGVPSDTFEDMFAFEDDSDIGLVVFGGAGFGVAPFGDEFLTGGFSLRNEFGFEILDECFDVFGIFAAE